MKQTIEVIGLGADGAASLRAEVVERIQTADFLAGGERHHDYFPRARGERFIIRDNLQALTAALVNRQDRERCVVLASGDPLFFGIGNYLVTHLGADHVRIEPALSSMQLAFARVGQAWHQAALASIHGRDLRNELLPLLGREVIGLFTQDGDSPAAVTRFLQRHALADQYEAVVAENLGAADERVTCWQTVCALHQHRFSPLNYLILRRCPQPDVEEVQRLRELAPGVPDAEFSQPAAHANFTRQEVRAVVLGKLAGVLRRGDLAWDLGAGLGTVAVELAVLRPAVEVLAVERDGARADYLRQNRRRFGAYNLRIIEGAAPAALAGEADNPHVIFIGGSGANLTGILDLAEQRLRAGGRLLANFVTLENLLLTYQRLQGQGWRCELTELNVARGETLGGGTALKPQRGVFILQADKPGVLP